MATATGILSEESSGIQQQGQPIWLYLLFFTSGIPAILYQIVWQRALFSLFGINIESVTIVVSGFMLGLGLGSLAGGAISRSKRLPPVMLFGIAELGISFFALGSLSIFDLVANYTRLRPLWVTGSISFLLVVFPTTLMGATLPLLIEHLVRRSRNVGSSVGALYFVNTLGSGAACIVAVRPLMSYFGQSGSVRCGALLNALVGLSALAYSPRSEKRPMRRDGAEENRAAAQTGRLMSFPLAQLCASFCGFAALSYEIIWYRLLAFASWDTAPTFVTLLGGYLIGLALGSRFAEGYTERHSVGDVLRVLPTTILGAAAVSFLINPLSAWVLGMIPPESATGKFFSSFLFLFLICHAAILFGALFPLIAHVAVDSQGAGRRVSYLYAANIIGSTLGMLLVGFVLMDRFSLYRIAWLLLLGGLSCAAITSWTAAGSFRNLAFQRSLALCVVTLFLGTVTRPVFATLYDRLLFKSSYPSQRFADVIENRSGMIGVTPDGTLFGGGVYDGRFNIDLLKDSNIIVRPFSLSAFHPNPAHVFMVGLGSGSWAQVIANHPQLQDLIIVDINPGYLEEVAKHQNTASLLHNPKVTIVTDDGRRWLLRHPQATFDTVIMNTSFYWRNHSSNLLSTEFLRIVRSHLRSNGVFFYNTTGSDDVVATGMAVFPYALRVINCLAVSDSPMLFDRARWRSVLLNYTIDGKPIIMRDDPAQLKKLDEIVNIQDTQTGAGLDSIETNEEIRHRLSKRKNIIITDNNMGIEWR